MSKKCVLNFWEKKYKKKKGFSLCLFLEIGWCFILNKKWKNECRIRFLRKNIFECQTRSGKKNDMSRIKNGVVKKNDDFENKKKCYFLLPKMFVWMKNDRDGVTRWKNLQKKVDSD